MGNEWAEIKDRDIRGRWCLIAVVFWPRFLVGVSADQDVISIGFGPVILDVYRKTDE